MRSIHVLALALCFGLISCGGNEEKNEMSDKEVVPQDTASGPKDAEKEFKFFTILANVPSPVADLAEINKAGYKYDGTLLNPTTNFEKYNTAFQYASNYGVYSTDLSYAATFSNSTDILKYYVTTRKAAEKAGSLKVFDEITKTGHFEENVKNPDSLKVLLERVDKATDEFLKNDHQLDVAATIVIGAWIETQYLNLSMIKAQKVKDQTVAVSKVWESKLHLGNILDLLTSYANNPDYTSVTSDLQAYMQNYEGATGADSFSKEKIEKMYADITAIRNKIIGN